MKEFYQDYHYRTTKMEKKKNRIKNDSNVNDKECKCLIHFLNLHCYNCPLVKTPCPIHTSILSPDMKYVNTKHKELDSESSMIISFHPMSKTDKLFQPVKSLFVRNCNTRNNYSYCSKVSNKEMYKSRQIQTSFEDLQFKVDNYFVSRKKSYAPNRTNGMKKLKQCFHSPCNSIVHKTQSQVSLRSGEIFMSSKKTRDICLSVNKTLKEGFFLNDNADSGWYCSDKVDSSDYEKTFEGELTNSGFIPISEHMKRSDLVNPTVFDVFNKNDNSFFKNRKRISRPTTNFDVGFFNPEDEKVAHSQNKREPKLEKFVKEEDPFNYSETNNGKEKTSKTSEESSEKSDSDSSGSVYYTPFILMPTRKDDSEEQDRENKKSKDKKQGNKEKKSDQSVPVNDETPNESEPPSLHSLTSKQEASAQTDEKRQGSTESKRSSILSEREKMQTLKTFPQISQTRRKRSLGNPKTLNAYTETDPDKDILIPSTGEIASTQTDNEFEKISFRKDSEPKEKENKITSNVVAARDESFHSIASGAPWESNEIRRLKNELKEARLPRSPKTLFEVGVQAAPLTINQYQTAAPVVFNKLVQTSGSDNVAVEETIQKKTTYPKTATILESENSKYPIVSPITGQESDQTPKKQPLYSEFQKSLSDGKLFDERNKCKCWKAVIQMPLPMQGQAGFNATVSNDGGARSLNDSVRAQEVTAKSIATTTNRECNNTSFSDLSELVRIINQHFDKMCDSPVEICECQMKYINRNKCENFENPNSVVSQNKNVVTVRTQTSFETDCQGIENSYETETEKRVKIQSSVAIDEPNHTSHMFVCKICKKSLRSVVVDVSTSTNNTPKSEGRKIRKIDSKTCEIIELESIKNFKIESEKLTGKTDCKETNKGNPMKTSPQTSFVMPKMKNENAQIRNIPPTPSPRKNMASKPEGKPQYPENFPIRKDDGASPGPSNLKSSSPAVKRVNEDDSLNNQPSRTFPLPKPVPSSRRPPQTDIYPSTKKPPWPGTTKPDPKTNQSDAKKESKPNGNRLLYSVTVLSNRPRELMRALQENVSKYELSSNFSTDSSKFSYMQKRNQENDTNDDIQHCKKIKCGKFELVNTSDICQGNIGKDLKECFVFGKSQSNMPKDTDFKTVTERNAVPLRRKRKKLEKDGGFVWVPSFSATEIKGISTVNESYFCQCLRAVTSDDKINYKQNTLPSKECLTSCNQNQGFNFEPSQSYKMVEDESITENNVAPTYQARIDDPRLVEDNSTVEESPISSSLFYDSLSSASFRTKEDNISEDKNTSLNFSFKHESSSSDLSLTKETPFRNPPRSAR